MENFITTLTSTLIPPDLWSVKATYEGLTGYLEHTQALDLAAVAVTWARLGIIYGLVIVALRLLFGGHFIQRRYHAVDYPLPHLLSLAMLAISLTGHPIFLSVIVAPSVCWLAAMLGANVFTALGPSPAAVSIVSKFPDGGGSSGNPNWFRRMLRRVIGRPFRPWAAKNSSSL